MRATDEMATTQRAAEVFGRAHGRAPAGVWAAPGRVNLIGEHTDYNDGFVLPFALPARCHAAAALRDDGLVSIRSLQESGLVTAPVTSAPGDVGGWAAYAFGVVWALREDGHDVAGIDLVVDSQVPLGAGLSSSAALECSVILALDELLALRIPPRDLARIARRAENEFVGAPTGGMDQTVSLLARDGHLLFLDTRSSDVEHIPLDLTGHDLALLVVDTRAPHQLVDGHYGERRAACEEGARTLGVRALRDVGAADLSDAMARIGDPVVARRVRHVVTENDRVRRVADHLRTGADPREVGPALTESHRSLRDDFEVSCAELDVAVDAALAAGAYGSRMTGGGFGGCTVSLVDLRAVDEIGRAVFTAFADAGFAAPTMFTAIPSAGAERIA